MGEMLLALKDIIIFIRYLIQSSCYLWNFPGGPVVKILCFQCKGSWFDPWLENWDLTCHMAEPKIFLKTIKN